MRLDTISNTKKASRITPAGAVSQIDNLAAIRISSEFDGTSGYDLLCQEDLIGTRLDFLKRTGLPSLSDDAKKLKAIRAEIKSRQKHQDLWTPTALEWQRRNRIWSYFPDEGPLSYKNYPKHMEFMAAGARFRRRLFCSGNKLGKSLVGAYEVTSHATGIYPHWWKGKRFDQPVLCWIANKSGKETRDINERTLLGPPGDEDSRGTGMIPSHRIRGTTPKPGIPNGCEFIYVEHVSGRNSIIQSKSFDAGRTAFQGAPEVHVIWADEECPKPIADECAMRTMTCGGILLFTYTPIFGMTELTVEMFDQAGIDLGALASDLSMYEESITA